MAAQCLYAIYLYVNFISLEKQQSDIYEGEDDSDDDFPVPKKRVKGNSIAPLSQDVREGFQERRSRTSVFSFKDPTPRPTA